MVFFQPNTQVIHSKWNKLITNKPKTDPLPFNAPFVLPDSPWPSCADAWRQELLALATSFACESEGHDLRHTCGGLHTSPPRRCLLSLSLSHAAAKTTSKAYIEGRYFKYEKVSLLWVTSTEIILLRVRASIIE